MSKLRVEDVFSSSSDEGDDVGARSNDEEEDVVNPLPTISHKRTLSFEDHDLPSTSASVVDSAQKKKQRKINSQATSSSGQLQEILNVVSDINEKVNGIETNFKGLDKRVSEIEHPTVETEAKKKKVTSKVRHFVRQVYKDLLEDADDFRGFDLKKPFSDVHNIRVVKRLAAEVKAHFDGPNSSIPFNLIKNIARRFYTSKKEDRKMRESGRYNQKIKQQRRRDRIKTKMEARKSSLNRTSSVKEEHKPLWMEVIVPEFMSSEDSDEENGKSALAIRPLTWRSPKVTKFFRQLDVKSNKYKSDRGRRQTIPRKVGNVSERSKPLSFPDDHWGFSPN